MNVVITGATKGIGRSVAETFAAAGCDVITCSRNGDDLQKMRADVESRFGISVKFKVTDLSNEGEVKAFGKWIVDENFLPEVLVNNAGYFAPGQIFNEAGGTLQKMLAVNLHAPYHLTRSLLPGMMERRSGHIFNICSIASFQPLPNVGSYGISKFALLGFTKHLREEMKPYGIKVTAVSPGATFTASWEGSNIDSERLINVNDVAKMIFAASQLSPSAVVEDIIIRPQLGDL